MAAVNTFYSIVQQVQDSNLNYHLQLTPFAAKISLKRTSIKDRFGRPLQSKFQQVDPKEALSAKICELESELADVKNEFASSVLENDKVLSHLRSTIKPDESDLQELAQCRATIEELNEARDYLLKENEKLKQIVLNKDREIKDLESSNKIKSEVADKLNKNLRELKEKYNKEKIEMIRTHKTDVKKWRKELGEETKLKIKLRKRLEDLGKSETVFKHENAQLKEELAVKDDELGKTLKEKIKLEEKLNSLLDVLYGCPECGLNNCECDDHVKEDESDPESSSFPQHLESQPSPPPTTPAAQLPPPPCSGLLSPWSPPPNPPCTGCGGINFGPSPSNLCIICIPPPQSNSPQNSRSPSRTPPGTPPTTKL